MMTWLKGFVRTKLLTLVLTLVAASFILFPLFPVSQTNPFSPWLTPVANAQRSGISIFQDLLERTGLYTPPRKGTAPRGRRVGGAGRGPICALVDNGQKENSVRALIPALRNVQVNNQEKQETKTGSDTEVGGLTVEARPTFWFYIPYVSTPETSRDRIDQRVAQFVLLDDADRPVWNELMTIELLNQPRLVEYPLSYELETDKLYHWYFSVICDSEKLSRNPVVQGWVQRVESTPELETALREASALQQYTTYADHGIWFETINSLVKIYREFPNINEEAWISLLTELQIPDVNQLYLLESTKPLKQEKVACGLSASQADGLAADVSCNQLPARI